MPAMVGISDEDLLTGRAGIPVTVLTGFLGSGKTTFLNGALEQAAVSNSAVLVNEYGRIAIDHLLIEKISDTVSLLADGCLCCAVQGDLVHALRDLLMRRLRGEVPPFQRVIVETSGLADPVPLLHTLIVDPFLLERYRMQGIVTVADAGEIDRQLDCFPEAIRQVAFADHIVVSKLDLVPAEGFARVCDRLRTVNASAPIYSGLEAAGALTPLFEETPSDPRSQSGTGGRWAVESYEASSTFAHTHNLSTFTIVRDRAVSWERFSMWVASFLAEHGEKVLRIKGLLHVEGMPPLVVHSVQHIFYPAGQIEAWPEGRKRTQLVFITQNLHRETVESEFERIFDPTM